MKLNELYQVAPWTLQDGVFAEYIIPYKLVEEKDAQDVIYGARIYVFEDMTIDFDILTFSIYPKNLIDPNEFYDMYDLFKINKIIERIFRVIFNYVD